LSVNAGVKSGMVVHQQFIARIQSEILSPHRTLHVKDLTDPSQCVLGKWLDRLNRDLPQSKQAFAIRHCHASIHAQAQAVLEALDRNDATRAMQIMQDLEEVKERMFHKMAQLPDIVCAAQKGGES
ncbi:MAG: CZB domain-containing protein, partial [Firmicutes bacterium]|nr:CZB domain-containing protein [Bacillota bacterium]